MARPPLPIENGASCQTPPTQVVEWEGSGGWHPRPRPARRRAGHAKPAVNPIACGSNPAVNPASAGVLNPALAGGHPPGQGSLAVLSKNVVLVRADQDAVFRGVGPRGPGDGNRRGASWSTAPTPSAGEFHGEPLGKVELHPTPATLETRHTMAFLGRNEFLGFDSEDAFRIDPDHPSQTRHIRNESKGAIAFGGVALPICRGMGPGRCRSIPPPGSTSA